MPKHKMPRGPSPGSGARNWAMTVCIVCAKTGGMELSVAHRTVIRNIIAEAGVTVKREDAPAIHFKCEEKLKVVARKTLNNREYGRFAR